MAIRLCLDTACQTLPIQSRECVPRRKGGCKKAAQAVHLPQGKDAESGAGVPNTQAARSQEN